MAHITRFEDTELAARLVLFTTSIPFALTNNHRVLYLATKAHSYSVNEQHAFNSMHVLFVLTAALGLSRMAKCVRWVHWQTVTVVLDSSWFTEQPFVDHLPVKLPPSL